MWYPFLYRGVQSQQWDKWFNRTILRAEYETGNDGRDKYDKGFNAWMQWKDGTDDHRTDQRR